MDRYCPYCGAVLPETAGFCANCGYAVSFGAGGETAEIGETVVLSEFQPEYQPEYQPGYQTEFQPEYPPDFQQEYQPQYQQFPQPEYQDPVQPTAPPRKKRRWPAVLATIAILLVAAAFLWQPIFIRVAPQTYLAFAMNRTNADMAKRQEGSPAELMEVVQNCTQKGTIGLNVKYDNPQLPDDVHVNADLSLQSDVESKQWLVDFALSSAQINADLSVFTSNHHISLGTSLYQEGKHYGITYDTIADDLRASIFGESLTDDQIDMVVKITDVVEEVINNAGNQDEFLKPYKELIEKFIKELKAEVGRGEVTIDGKNKACDIMTYTLEQDDLMQLLEDLVDLLMKEEFIQAAGLRDQLANGINQVFETIQQNADIELKLTYYFYHAKVAAMSVDVDFELDQMESTITMELLANYGTNAAENDIVTEVKIKANGQIMKGTLVSSVKRENGNYKETVTLNLGGNAMDGEDIDIEFITNWKKDAEKLEIGFSLKDGEESYEATIPLGLKVTNDGFELFIENIFDVLTAIDKDGADFGNGQVCSLQINFSNKCDISAPEYVNFDKITEDDVTAIKSLLESFGFGGEAEDDDIIFDDCWGVPELTIRNSMIPV